MACEPCPVGSACVGTGNTLAFLPLAKGYYRASMDSLDLRKCPDFNTGNGSACIGGSFYQSCRPWTTGPYCRLCNVSDSSRYYDSSKSECLPCEGSTTMPLVTLAVITVSVLLLFCWCGWRKPYNRVPSHIRNRWFKLGHQLVSTLRAPAKQMIAFYQASPCMTPNHPCCGSCRASARARSRSCHFQPGPCFICMPPSLTSQIATRVPTVFAVSMPASVAALLDSFEGINLNIDAFGLPLACLQISSFFNRLLFVVLAPCLLALLIVAWCTASEALVSKCSVTTLNRGLIRAMPYLLGLTFLAFPMVSSLAFQAFLCDEFDDETQFLKADYKLDCNDPDEYHRVVSLAVVAIGLYPIAIPLVCLLLLLKARTSILTEQPTALSRSLAFLHQDYEPPMFWWEIVEIFKKVRPYRALTITSSDLVRDWHSLAPCSSFSWASAYSFDLDRQCNSSLPSSSRWSCSFLRPSPSRTRARPATTSAC